MIVTFTDFGIAGPYLGQMKAAIRKENPRATIVDLFNDLPVYNIKTAAYLLPAYTQYLPEACVCLCVVDPGVGSDRRALALEVDSRWYVGPDNGLFSVLIQRAGRYRFFEIKWRPENLSNSFHGRDLFAPIAARLALDQPVTDGLIDTSELYFPSWPDELEEVVYLDAYGNAITGLRGLNLNKNICFDVCGHRCVYRRTYHEAQSDPLFWYENSNGLVEIAVASGSAVDLFDIQIGMPVIQEKQ